jgi:hypothetical protein
VLSGLRLDSRLEYKSLADSEKENTYAHDTDKQYKGFFLLAVFSLHHAIKNAHTLTHVGLPFPQLALFGDDR